MSGSGVSGNFISNIQGNTGTAVQFGTNKQGSAWVWATCTNVLNVWDLYTATYNNGAMKLYKNGALQSSATYTNWGAASASLPFYIGKGIQSNSYFNGSMDDLGIWTRALTQTEITNLYNNSPNGISESNIMTDISVYPNPANDFIKVKIGSKQYGLQYSVTDQSGRNLLTGKLNNEITNIDISRLNSGVYILQVGESRKQSFSIIKQ